MEKISKVTNVQGQGTWSNSYGTFYKFEVAFENGDAGEYSSKSQDQDKFVVGQETAYEITSREVNGVTYYKIKPAQQQQSSGGGGKSWKNDPLKDARITRMACLKAAVDFSHDQKLSSVAVLQLAAKFEVWVNQAQPAPAPQGGQTSITKDDDGLPF